MHGYPSYKILFIVANTVKIPASTAESDASINPSISFINGSPSPASSLGLHCTASGINTVIMSVISSNLPTSLVSPLAAATASAYLMASSLCNAVK